MCVASFTQSSTRPRYAGALIQPLGITVSPMQPMMPKSAVAGSHPRRLLSTSS